jgi:hypothetical protein
MYLDRGCMRQTIARARSAGRRARKRGSGQCGGRLTSLKRQVLPTRRPKGLDPATLTGTEILPLLNHFTVPVAISTSSAASRTCSGSRKANIGTRCTSCGHGNSTAKDADAWVLHKPGVSAAIAGSRDGSHVKENAEASSLDLNGALDELEKLIPLGPTVVQP